MKRQQLSNKVNYGVITDVSKSLNQFFGDQTGRTVSVRTAHGFKNIFNCPEMEEDAAEFIVHTGMVTAYTLLKSKKESDNGSGLLLSLGLLLCYQSGK
jgi:hypothetical protein